MDKLNILDLPEEIILTIISYLSLRDVFNLELTNKSFRILNDSSKAEIFWHHRLEYYFPKCSTFKSIGRSSRDYFKALMIVFHNIGINPLNPDNSKILTLLNHFPDYIFDEYHPKIQILARSVPISYDNNCTRYSSKGFEAIVRTCNLHEDHDVAKAMINLALTNFPSLIDHHKIWRRLIDTDQYLTLAKWVYATYNLHPYSLFLVFDPRGLQYVNKSSIEYLLSIMYKNNIIQDGIQYKQWTLRSQFAHYVPLTDSLKKANGVTDEIDQLLMNHYLAPK